MTAAPNAVRASTPSAYAETRREPRPFKPSSVNAEGRTAVLIISTGAGVARSFGTEVLDLAGCDLSRLDGAGIPLLDAHDTWSMKARFGMVTGVRREGAMLLADVRFDRTPAGDLALQLAQEGAGVSIGYRVDAFKDETDPNTGFTTRTVTRWTLLETSFVPIAADGAAFVRGSTMSQTAPAPAAPANPAAPAVNTGDAIAARQAEFRAVARAFNQSDRDALRAGMNFATAEDWRGFMLDERAAEGDRTAARANVVPVDAGGGSPSRDAAIVAALAHRMNPALGLAADAREFRSLSLLDLARDCLALRGERGVHRMPADRVFEMATRDIGPGHGTGDFPYLLNTAGARVLQAAYEQAASPLKALAFQRTASDFKALSVLRLGEHPKLEEVAEHGEVKNVTIGEAKETYRLKTYAAIFGITRQALINDDLGAFAQFGQVQGRAAAETEAGLLADLLVSNPAMGDTKALFHTDHGNLAASGAAIGETTLSAARLAMRTQKGVDGVQLAPAVPKTLLVGPAKETEAEKQLAALNAAQTTNVNPFAGKLELAVEPRLTGNGWYVFADPALMPVLEYAYLNGLTGPQISVREGWRRLGTEFRVVHDFGCGVVDYRGAYKNPGN